MEPDHKLNYSFLVGVFKAKIFIVCGMLRNGRTADALNMLEGAETDALKLEAEFYEETKRPNPPSPRTVGSN